MDEPKAEDLLPHQVPGEHSYSLGKALRQLGRAHSPGGTGKVDGLELEVHQELRRRGHDGKGLLIPIDARTRARRTAERRSLDAVTAGGASVQTTLVEVIDVLRARSVLGSLGARTLEIGRGLSAMPVKATTSQPSWVNEGAAPAAETNFSTTAQVKFTPHTITGFTDTTRLFLDQAIPTIEDVIFGDLMTSTAVEVDRVGLNGSAASGQPGGLLSNQGVTVYPVGTNGGALALADLCAIEAAIGNANADAGAGVRLGWAATPNGRSKLRRTQRAAGSSNFLWTDEDTVLGKPALATSNLPSNLAKGTGTNLSALLFGNWDDLVIGHWGVMDLMVDPYKFSTLGFVRFRSYWDVDVEVRHPASFQAVQDFLTT